MPSELRILRFRLDETSSAVRNLAPRIRLTVPPGTFAAAEAVTDNEAPATAFTIKDSGDRFVISNGQLAASLIKFCQQAEIPIPRDGKKEIYVSPEFVELRSAMHHG